MAPITSRGEQKQLPKQWKAQCGVFAIGFLIGFMLPILWYLLLVPLNGSEIRNLASHHLVQQSHFSGQPSFRVACFVMTGSEDHLTKATAVARTWGRHCRHLTFISDQENASLPAVSLNTTRKEKGMWSETNKILRYAHDNYLHRAEWFLTAAGDNYFVMGNLYHLIRRLDHRSKVYIGTRTRQVKGEGELHEAAGYVVSAEALRHFAANAPTLCKNSLNQATNDGTSGLEKCFSELGVSFVDAADYEIPTLFYHTNRTIILNTHLKK